MQIFARISLMFALVFRLVSNCFVNYDLNIQKEKLLLSLHLVYEMHTYWKIGSLNINFSLKSEIKKSNIRIRSPPLPAPRQVRIGDILGRRNLIRSQLFNIGSSCNQANKLNPSLIKASEWWQELSLEYQFQSWALRNNFKMAANSKDKLWAWGVISFEIFRKAALFNFQCLRAHLLSAHIEVHFALQRNWFPTFVKLDFPLLPTFQQPIQITGRQ